MLFCSAVLLFHHSNSLQRRPIVKSQKTKIRETPAVEGYAHTPLLLFKILWNFDALSGPGLPGDNPAALQKNDKDQLEYRISEVEV